MPFVNEKVRKEDIARIDWNHYGVMPFADTAKLYPWTIDRDRGVFFLRLRNSDKWDCAPFDVYGLIWNGKLIRVEAIVVLKDRPGFMTGNIHWDILRVDIPELLTPESQSIHEVLKEAIEAYGYIHNRDRVHEVHVSIR